MRMRKMKSPYGIQTYDLRENSWVCTVASWLVSLSWNWAVRVPALGGDVVLCFWAKHFTLTVSLSTQMFKQGLANINAGVTLRLTSTVVASCNWRLAPAWWVTLPVLECRPFYQTRKKHCVKCVINMTVGKFYAWWINKTDEIFPVLWA